MSPDYVKRLTGLSNIHLRKLDQVPKQKSQQYIFQKNKPIFRPHLHTLRGVSGVADQNKNES